ncbi:MAG: BMP family ABC transporter substrate-binding protein [Eubacteriaceae bacterium]|nr:BMP family ABC transporter substrate-binding protein [Eubacteriaceae bacterium]
MKRTISLLLAVLLATSLVACGGGGGGTQGGGGGSTTTETYELALITDLGTIDDKSFNQGSWEGLVKYANENNISHKYYQPTEQSDDAYLAAIDLAVTGGAKLIVTPGFLFEVPVYAAQEIYPDVMFVLIDGTPHDATYSDFTIAPNTAGVTYAEEQAGFLAGYAAVKDGYTKLGFMGGMAVPAVVRFGYGFVQGCDYAAAELGLAQGSVTVNYHYTGEFAATPEAVAMAASWYNDGIEVIFACGGALGNSVMAAAETAETKVIGVDVDQSGESPTVITSAMKGLQPSVYDCVKAFYDGAFPGGEHLVFAADNDGVGIAIETAKFETFTEADYNEIYAKLVDNSISIVGDVDASGGSVALEDIPVTIVTATEIKS